MLLIWFRENMLINNGLIQKSHTIKKQLFWLDKNTIPFSTNNSVFQIVIEYHFPQTNAPIIFVPFVFHLCLKYVPVIYFGFSLFRSNGFLVSNVTFGSGMWGMFNLIFRLRLSPWKYQHKNMPSGFECKLGSF